MNRNPISGWLSLFPRLVAILLIVGSQLSFAARYRAPDSETTEPYRTWTMPGTTLASPSGFGANWGQVYAGGGYQNKTRNNGDSDGSVGIGFGVGNSARLVGLDVSVAVFDVSKFRNGALNLKLHRQLPAGFGVAVGAESLLSFGDTFTNPVDGTSSSGVDPRDKAFYGTVSKIFFLRDESQWFSALTLTAGIGSGRFRSLDDRTADTGSVNFFGSTALRVKQPLALIADWSGQALNIGASITPIRSLGFFINPVLADVAGISGQSARFTLGLGLAFTFT